MKIFNTKFSGLKIIKGINHYDKRGYFRETFKNIFFKKKNFIFWCMSKSKKNVIKWPTTKPILSKKDKNNITFEKFNNS